MTIPQTLSNAFRAASRVLSDGANKDFQNTLELYSTMLLGDMVIKSVQDNDEGNRSPEPSNYPYSFEKVADFVTSHFPMSEFIQSMPASTILEEIKDIAWEIEGCVIETISYMVNELDVNPYIMCSYGDIPSIERLKAWKNLVDQLLDLGLPLDQSSTCEFIKGLLEHRWNLFATTLETESSSDSSSI